MSLQDAIVLIVVAGAGFYVLRYIWRTLGGRSTCHCADGSGGCGAAARDDAMRLKRTPLVTVERDKSTASSQSCDQGRSLRGARDETGVGRVKR